MNGNKSDAASKPIKATELDKRFDDGEDMSDYIDRSSAKRPNQPITDKGEPPQTG
jgi:hypothetical protein